MRYPNAAKGIKKIYLAEILSILAAVLAIVLVIIAAANKVDVNMTGEEATQALQSANAGAPFVILGAFMIVLMIVSFFMNFIGISNASKDEEGFRRALWVLVASIVFSVVGGLLENTNPKIASWLNVPAKLFELVVMIYVLEGIANLANNLGKRDIAGMSVQCKTWLMSALVLSAAAEFFVALGTTGSAFNTASGVAAALLQIVAYVVYLRVLNKARLMQ